MIPTKKGQDINCPKCKKTWMYGWDTRTELLDFLAKGVSCLKKRFFTVKCMHCSYVVEQSKILEVLLR